MSRLAFLPLLALLVACGGEPAPRPQLQAQPTSGAEGGEPSLAGTWVRAREDAPDMVFEVQDDGHTVHGTLLSGQPEDCTDYTFDLNRVGDGTLSGTSTVTFMEADGLPMAYHTRWTAYPEPGEGSVAVDQEWIQVDDTAQVVDSGWDVVDYELEPVVSPAPAPAESPAEQPAEAPAEQPGETASPEPTELPAAGGGHPPVQAPSRIELGQTADVGMMVEQTTHAAGTESTERWAIVGDAGDAWQVEHTGGSWTLLADSFPTLKGTIMGLTVSKADGTVTHAVLGHPGEAGDAIQVREQQVPPTEAPPAEGGVEALQVKAGDYAATRTETEQGTSWKGVAGVVEGLVLRWESPQESFELAEAPTTEEVQVGDRTVKAVVARYTNGLEWWLTPAPEVIAFFPYGPAAEATRGFLRTINGKVRLEITAIDDHAQPQLRWE